MAVTVRRFLVRVWGLVVFFALIPLPYAVGDETISFTEKLNVIRYPVQVPSGYSSYDFLRDLRGSGDVVSIQRFDRTGGTFQTATWDQGTGAPVGVDFPINSEDGYFVYSNDAFSFIFPGDRDCIAVNLKTGYNLVGFPCFDGLTAFDLLDELGESHIVEIRRYDAVNARYQRAYWESGAISGVDFDLRHGEGYQVEMLSEASVSIALDPPTHLIGYPGNNMVALAWDPSPGPVAGYNVYRSNTSGGPFTKVNTDLVPYPSFSDQTVANGSTYFYVVRAKGYMGDESGDSNKIGVSPLTTGPTTIQGTQELPHYVWTLAGSPYIVKSNTTFLSYSKLTIEPGVAVRFDGNYSMDFYGNVETLGTDANPIVFTSNKATPARGDWAGINIMEDGVSSLFQHCIVEYAEVGFDIAFGSPTIRHCIIRQSNDRGINLISTANALIEHCNFQSNRYYAIVVDWNSNAVIRYNTIKGNNQDGIYVARSAPEIAMNTIQSNTRYGIYGHIRAYPQILENDISSNGNYGIYIQGNDNFKDNPRPVIHGNRLTGNGNNYDLYLWDFGGDRIDQVIDATNNWWGSTNPRTIGARIYDYNDNTGEGGVVDYRGFLLAQGGSPVSGNFMIAQRLTGDTTWTASQSPIILLGRILVPAGVTLTVQAGTEVQLSGLYYILVYGKLLAEGTESQRIRFTSDKSSPARGDWGGIYFYPESDPASILHYCTIEYADTYGVYCSAASPTISNCLIQQCNDRGVNLIDGSQAKVLGNTIQNNRYYGIVVASGSTALVQNNVTRGNGYEGIHINTASPTVIGNTVQSNSRYGIYVLNNSKPQITGNTISNNGNYGIALQGDNSSALQNPLPVITGNAIFSNGNNYDLYAWNYMGDRAKIMVNATGNWWGSSDPRTIGGRIYDYNDNTGEGPIVNYTSFLNAQGGSPVSGSFILGQTLSGNTTWTKAGSPYTVLGSIVIPVGITLTIDPGVELRFAGGYYLYVSGKLAAQGTPGDEILLTSNKASPAKGDWGGVYFYDESDDTSILSYTTVRYAGSYSLYCAKASPSFDHVTVRDGNDIGLYCTSESAPSVSQCTFQNNFSSGIYLDGGSHPSISDTTLTGNRYGIYMTDASPSIQGCTVQANTSYGIWVLRNSEPLIRNSKIINNGSYGFYVNGENNLFTNPRPLINGSSLYGNGGNYDLYTLNFGGDRLDTRLDASGNWWGTNNPRAIGGRIYDYNDNTAEGPVVNYLGFLDGEGGSPVPGNFVLAHRVYSDTTWEAAQSPYIMLGRAVVVNGAELTVEPGVEVQFTGPYYLLVQGKLTSVGTPSDPIRITSDKTSPARGDWSRIIFYDESDDTSRIAHTTIEYGEIGIECRSASPTIDHTVIASCSNVGVYLLAASQPVIEDSWLYNNANQALYIEEGSDATVRRNIIAQTTGSDGIYVKDSSPLIEDNLIEKNKRYGIYIDINSKPSIMGNSVVNNTSYGIYVRGNSNVANNPMPTMNDNNLFGNGNGSDLRTETFGSASATTLDAKGNWWGTSVSGTIENRIYHRPDSSSSPLVDYSGFAAAGVGVPAVYNLAIDDAIFSPDGNGIQDQVTVTGTFTETSNWTVTVRDGSDHLVKEYSGSGDSVSQTWDGKTTGGVTVADGVYKIYVSAVAGGETSVSRMIQSRVDNTPPAAHIDASFKGATLEKVIQVVGSAEDANFTQYELQYGAGASPGTWTRIGSLRTQPVVNNTLETWLTNDESTANAYYSNGPYTLRLIVRDDAGNESVDTAQITLDNLYISSVSRSPSTINGGQGEKANISFTLSKPATVKLKIYPEWLGVEGGLVKEVTQVFGAAGSQTMSWDGKDSGGRLVEDEAYIYVLEAASGARSDAYLPTSGHEVGGGSGTIDASYNAFTNDYWQMIYNQYSGPGRVSMQITPSGEPAFWLFENRPLEAGDTLLVWDGRRLDGSIVEQSTNIYFPPPWTMRPNYIITKGAVPVISGQAPYIEVKADPYLLTCSYGQFSRFLYAIDQDARVTVKLLPPGISDSNSSEAIVVVDDELQTAGNHTIADWSPADETDPNANSFLIEADGAYTLIIEATDPDSGFSSLWRATITIRQ
jgi:parallel beta-helix repeat protein